MKYNKKGESRIEISDILDYFKDINSMYNDCLRHDTLKRMLEDLVAETREDVELERKTGKWVRDPKSNRWRCSECYSFALRTDYREECLSDYCSVCGAYMKGESNEQT